MNKLGIDEVGRGAWAGPLVVGACVLNGADIDGLTDSKKLTKKQREILADEILKSSAIVGLGWVFNDELDQIGLSESLRLATRRAVEKVQAKCKKQNVKFTEITIDGTVNFLEKTPLENYVSTLKKADLLISSVSAAAIVAKVSRDRFMTKLDEFPEFSAYNFAGNSGYGTAKHRQALQEFGVSEIHRKSFKPIAEFLKDGFINNENNDLSIAENKKDSTKSIGDRAEEKVTEYFSGEGYEIVARNWRTRFCEIDIVAQKDEILYFIEVKYRKNSDFGGGISALSKNKIKQMEFAAEFFIHKNNLSYSEMRLIGVVVEGREFEIEEIFEL